MTMGDSPRIVNVKSTDHHQALVDGLWNFFITQHGVDFDFNGPRPIHAHRLIVEVFMPPKTSKEEVTEMQLPPANHLDLLVEFLYRGQVAVREEQLESLRLVAQELNFKMLVDAVLESTVAGDTNVEDDCSTAAVSITKSRRTVLRQRRGARRQRKGNPVKIIPADHESRLTDETHAEEWISPSGRRLRATRSRKEVDTLKESSDEDVTGKETEEDWNASADEVSGNERTRADLIAVKSRTKRKAVARLSGGGAVKRKRKVGRPKATNGVRRQPTLKCGHCPYKTYCKTRFQVHAARHDPSVVIFRCVTCSKPFLTEESFEGHRASHACEPKIFKCPHCPYQTAKKVAHQIHLAKHDPSVAVFKCETCHRPFSCRESLERHQLRHRIYNCPHCSFVTPKGGSYHHHLRSVHKVNTKGEAAQKRFKCSDCPKTYMYESELKYHSVAMHSGEKPFRCPQCPYSTGRKVDVKRHIKVAHENIKPYLCENCGFRAVTPFNLERHRLSHTGLKPYKCEACGQSFADRDTLKRHSRLHFKNDKPFVCHVCGHAFNRRHNLKVHLKNVHKTPMEPETIKL